MKKNFRKSDEQPLSQVIDKILKAYGLDKKIDEMEVLNGWPEMMGIAVSNRTKDIKIINKVLIVSLDSAVIREELSNGKKIIIERVNQFAKKEIITDVWFK